jgi:threonine dehydrogenase-like Zn-dependent dehydrogenase
MTHTFPSACESVDDSRTASAARIIAPGRIELVPQLRPHPGPGEVVLRVEGCGVCASNLAPWAGPAWMNFPTEPGALGHEAWGVIETVGADVSDFAPGDRVAALSYNAYAAYDVADAGALVRLPRELDGAPFPGEPLGCAMNIYARAGVEPGQTIAIVGIGFLGALLTQLARSAGAHVIAISRRAYALDVARRMGAHETIAMDDHRRIIETVRARTGGRFCERVIEAVGAQWPLDLAAELTAERGRLVIAGYHQDGPRQVNMQLWNWRGLDVINAHERDPGVYLAGMRAAVEAVASGRLDPSSLYTHVYPLHRLDEALNATRDRPEGFLKAIVTP